MHDVCLWLDAAEHANEIYNHSKRTVLGQNDVVEPIVLERRAFSGQAECDLLPRERDQVHGLPGLSGVCDKIGTSRSASRKSGSHRIARILVGWNRRAPHGIKIATFRDDGEVEEVFTSTTVRTRDTVFPLFSGAGTKSATPAELQEFDESVRARPDEAEGPSLALRRPDVEPEEGEDNLAAGEDMQVDGGREQPDPEELRRRAAEARAELEHVPRRWVARGSPARSHGAESR